MGLDLTGRRAEKISIWAGLVITAIGMLGSTPLSWILMGSRPEDYPELFFLGIVLPLGLCLLVLWWFLRARRKAVSLRRRQRLDRIPGEVTD